MTTLAQSQIDFFNENGYLVVENAVDPGTLKSLVEDFAIWVDESKAHTDAYDDGKIKTLINKTEAFFA